MKMVLLGAPGAGKGTQCKRIAERFCLVHLSSGDILRHEISEGTELGKKASSYMYSGELVPDEVIVEMMAGAISDAPSSGFVLDGFPRTVNQAKELDKSLSEASQKINIVLNLEVDDDAITRRITGRRSCPKCGAVYHVENLKPKTEGKCDKDGTELVQRPDDRPEVVKNRLVNYYQQTKPVVNYYNTNNQVYNIDSNKSVNEVTELVIENLKSFASI